MKYLLDTDHLSIVQRQSGPAYARLRTRIVQHPLADLAFSIISFHEQVLVRAGFVVQPVWPRQSHGVPGGGGR